MPWNGTVWVPYDVIGGNATSMLDLLEYNNDITGGIFGIGVLVAVFLVILVAGSTRSTAGGLSAATFITTIMSILMVAMGALPDYVAWIMIMATMGVAILLGKGGSGNV